jgi:N-methylhydantoinase A
VELVTLRLRSIVKSAIAHGGMAAPSRQGRTKPGRIYPPEAQVLFDGKKLKTTIYSRNELRVGKKYSGPAIVTEYSATTVIPIGKRFYLDDAENLIVRVG